ncbi:hypothetical protein E1193_21445 [Micromonospora sp. KC606]|uniref:hypothetical protein n=1 Tax=Micromonospora sp. KC606 TaxID=2530379 RepID=UPI001053B1E9|nr:hypothetical protein [Micromonospora sp. KC606]TDC78004.1 hypothetical protein E1193_21445 [Micromonospora sp. KC606]
MTIHHRRHAVELVREVMTRGQDTAPPPVLIFEGDRGSGKTALLTGLAGLLDGRVPYAHIDLEADGRTGTPEVLYALAFHLGRPCPLYGTLHFPRLAVGKLVMDDDTLDLRDRDRARQQINALLREHRGVDRLVTTLREGAGDLPAVLPAGMQTPVHLSTRLLASVIHRLASGAWSSRFVLGRAQKWYGTQGAPHPRPPVETLIDLNRWHRRPGEANNARQRDELLWAAFRADLTAGLGRRLRRPWMPRCVVLIDNADTRLGRHFLIELARGRETAQNEPLAVVATSRAPFLGHLPEAQQRLLAAEESLTSGRDADQPRPRWVRYPLPALTDADVVHRMAREHPDLEPRLPRQIQQLGQGNPLVVSMLLAAAHEVSSWPEGGEELALALARLEPTPADDTDRRQFTVEERLIRHLLGVPDADPLPVDEMETLTTCAAARTVEQATTLAVRSGLLTGDGYAGRLGLMFDSLRSASPDADPPPLRRLLLRRLAARDPDGGDGWNWVHALLRDQCRARGDRAGELYHALALDQLEEVSDQFATGVGAVPAADWLAMLRAVTRAPTHRPHTAPPTQEAHRLARSTGADPESRLGRVTRLVVGLRLAADPFTGRLRADLHDGLKRDYRALALHFPDDQSLLVAEANRHKGWADQWR